MRAWKSIDEHRSRAPGSIARLKTGGGNVSVGRSPFSSLLGRVTALLEDVLSVHPIVARDAADFVHSGKRLRAQLLFAAADGTRLANDDQVVSCAAAVELLHAASLVHDDIVDRSDKRRGRDALHRTIGSRDAALAGLCLFQLALELMARLERRARTRIFSSGRDLARGQFVETVRRHDVDLTPAESIAIARRKTGSVFGLACELGGLLTDRDARHCQRWRQVGASFGVLYQIADDVDDLFADPKELGREPGADLREGVISLPLAIALQRERESLRPLLGMHDATARCREIVIRSDALAYSLRTAHARLHDAKRTLRQLPITPGTRWMSRLLDDTQNRIARHATRRRRGIVIMRVPITRASSDAR